MKNLIIILITATSLIAGCGTETPTGPAGPSGPAGPAGPEGPPGPPEYWDTITADTTWDKNSSPYLINKNVLVESGATLSIEPGTIIKIYPECKIRVEGTIKAIGTSSEHIQLVPYSIFAGAICLYASNNSEFRYCDASVGIRFSDDSTGSIKFCNIYHYFTIDNINGSLSIENNNINTQEWSIYFQRSSNIVITYNNIQTAGSERRGIQIDHCDNISLTYNNIIDNSSYGVKAYSCANFDLSNNYIAGNNGALPDEPDMSIAAPDSSSSPPQYIGISSRTNPQNVAVTGAGF